MQNGSFHCEVENSGVDSESNKVTIVKCHGKLVSETAQDLKNVVKPLIPQGGRIVVDLADVNFLDSSALGALVGLKASAINQGYCKLELENMTPRIMDLLRMLNLAQIFAM